ncbi:YitT family protein [Hespellia stercorisuis]|uniref:Uncharacterized membrane-anchored protein YitT, contains DUF161 and DUF2179 domains n=1 Tax=Hespellia stercorisuis DSM 15480 TaxID=1121950 RepID=A0A1M6JMA8_9FIRM|nr:YitT family protein [Hespellia stercorisuis]SHJ47869.1 Uncharacterized membrane-anchored protein YitT, contains DUF161 and DUF2179 domains [Hespellia stercorisuis DSM 15480]
MKKKTRKTILKEYGILTIGAVVVALSEYLFKFPNHFSFGGVTGIAVILSGMLGGTASTYTFVINLLLMVLGIVVLGKSFGLKTIYVTLLFNVTLELAQYVYPMNGTLTEQPLLELVFSFMILAVVSAIFFNMDASSGGTDVIAMILKKYTSISIGKALLVTDFCIVLLSFYVYGATVGLFSLAGFLAKSFFIDSVTESLNMCKYFTIISGNPRPICEYIQRELKHGATIYGAEGGFTHEEKTVIMTVVNREQAMMLRKFVRETDEKAFMMITNSSEIIGEGFRESI